MGKHRSNDTVKHVWTRHVIQMDLEPDAIKDTKVICTGNEVIFNHRFARLGHDL